MRPIFCQPHLKFVRILAGKLGGIKILGKLALTGDHDLRTESDAEEVGKVVVLLLVFGISSELFLDLLLNLVLGSNVKIRGSILNGGGESLVLFDRLGYGAKTNRRTKDSVYRLNKLGLGRLLRLGNDVKKTCECLGLLLYEFISCGRLLFLGCTRISLLIFLNTLLKLIEVGTCNVNDKVIYGLGGGSAILGSFLGNKLIGIEVIVKAGLVGVVRIDLTALANALYELMNVGRNVVRIGLTALALALYKLMNVRRNVVGVDLTALALALDESMLVRRNVVRIGVTALALALYEVMGMLGDRNVVGVDLTASAHTLNECMNVRRNIVRIAFAASTLALYECVNVGRNVVGIYLTALALALYELMLMIVGIDLTAGAFAVNKAVGVLIDRLVSTESARYHAHEELLVKLLKLGIVGVVHISEGILCLLVGKAGSLVIGIGLAASALTAYEVVNVGNVVGVGLTASALALYKLVNVRRNVIGIDLTALTLTLNKGVLMRRNVVRIGIAALTLAIYEVMGMLGDRNVVGVDLTASAHTLNEGVNVRRNIVRIAFTASALALYKLVNVGRNIVGVDLTALTLALYELMLVGRNVIGIGLTALTLTLYELVLMVEADDRITAEVVGKEADRPPTGGT